jgi:hypothetical protein
MASRYLPRNIRVHPAPPSRYGCSASKAQVAIIHMKRSGRAVNTPLHNTEGGDPSMSSNHITCEQCSTPFYRSPSQNGPARFCSRRCKADSLITTRQERFWFQVDHTDTCWLWTGHRNNKGYGYLGFGTNGKRTWHLVHRLSWEWTYGPIPDDLCVLHHCDRPSCVRPDHLFLGTRPENTEDMRSKGRAKHWGHPRPNH